jgi:probable HAF family extracellular repeat protein
MKSKTLTCITAITLLTALALPDLVVAQHVRYHLIEIRTFGGPASFLGDPGVGPGVHLLNNRGMLAGKANTSVRDPNCGDPNCFLSHAFLWQKDMLTDLGTLSGGDGSGASSINARGWVAGGSSTSKPDPLTGGFQFHAVLWTLTGIIDVGTLADGLESNATAVNDGGEVIGFSTINVVPDPFSFLGGTIHPFVWRKGVMEDLGTLGGPEAFGAPGCANERSGQVVGFSLINSTPNAATGIPTANAFLWDHGRMMGIPTLGGTLISGELDFALCANNRGQVAGASMLPGDSIIHPFLWDKGVLADLGTLGGDNGVINWLNNGGDIVGTTQITGNSSFHATLWTNGVAADLGTLPGDCFSSANAINSDGRVVGASASCDFSVSRAVLWDKGTIIDLNTRIPPDSGLQLVDASQINDRGEIAGRALPPGCDDVHICGRVYLLIPCSDAISCEHVTGIAATPNNTAVVLKHNALSHTPMTPMERLANWRHNLMDKVHLPRLGFP